jgi:cold shock CspA family protein
MPAADKQRNAKLATGRLIFWNADRGFGFLRRDVIGDEIFISGKEARLCGVEADHLQIGTRFSFELRQDENHDRRPWAAKIRLVSEAPA